MEYEIIREAVGRECQIRFIGNHTFMVTYGLVVCYYIMNNGKIFDVQYD